MPGADNASGLLRALAHETRRRILAACIQANGTPISPSDLARGLRETLNHVGYHVQILARYNALTLVGTTTVRGATEHLYLPAPGIADLRWLRTVLDHADTEDQGRDAEV